MSQNNLELEEDLERPSVSKKKLIITLIVGIATAIGLAFGYVYVVDPMVKENKASKQLSKAFENRAPMSPSNTESLPYSEANSSTALALGKNGSITDPAALIFSNGKDNPDKSTFSIYMDFSSQRSRDFLAMNNGTIKNMIESGVIDLEIYPVPTSDPFSVYAGETLSETFASSPEKAWYILIELLKISTEIDTSETVMSNEDIIARIATSSESVGAVDVTADSIRSGKYANWLLTIGDDSRVKNEFGLPGLYVDGTLIDQDSVNINDSASLVRLMKGNSSK